MNPHLVCSVCIATYKRTETLKRLILSLHEQNLPCRTHLEVIVVDNDPQRSASKVIDSLSDMSFASIKYFVQPVKNISLTRNMAVHAASGNYIFFVDDDEVVTPEWISRLLVTREAYQSDGAVGPVVPVFNNDTPEWMKEAYLFYGHIYKKETGAEIETVYTNNCMIRASLLKNIDGPFDPAYGNSGGEDTHLFQRLRQGGARFVFCLEAPVYEALPPGRTNVSYLLKRALKSGNNYFKWQFDAGPLQGGNRFPVLMKAVLYAFVGSLLLLLHIPNRTKMMYWLMKVVQNFGKILGGCGFYYKMYK
jgi:succinoglycan biosynthesis protein ExoM